MPYQPQGLTGASQRYQILPSDTALASADTERSTTTYGSYVKMKEIKINVFGRIRTYFELKYSGDGAYGVVYRNGYPVGTERYISVGNAYPNVYYAFTEDIDGWMEGDLYQLYAKAVPYTSTAYVRNFRLCGSIQPIISPPVARVELD
jgi:hypothetical protein